MAPVKKSKRKTKKTVALSFSNAIQRIKKRLRQAKPQDIYKAIATAIKTVSKIRKNIIKPTRVIKIPKTGGILPLIPIFAGLSALGALAGGAAGVAKAVTDTKAARRQLDEAARHNQTMEAIALRGNGLFLRPYKSGLGL